MNETGNWLKRIYVSEAVSNIGSRMSGVAVMYLLYRETGRGSDIGLLCMLMTLPGIIFANPFGRLADRFCRKSLLVYADVTRACLQLILALFVPLDNLALLLCFVFATQVFRTLYDTSVIPLVSDLTQDQERMAKATANLKMIFHASLVFGLGVGGFVSYHVRPQYIFMLDAASFIFSALLIGSIPLARRAGTTYRAVLKEILDLKYYAKWFQLVGDGMKLAGGNDYRRAAVALEFLRDFAYGLLNPLASFWPQAVFSTVKNGLGISAGMVGAGCVLGGLLSNRYLSGKLSGRGPFFKIFVLLVLAELVATAAAYSSDSFWLFAASALAAAVFMNAFEIGLFVKYISTGAQDEKGALTGFYQFVMRLSIFLGGGVYALIADKLSVRLVPVVPLGILAAAILLLLLRERSFRNASLPGS